MFDTQVQIIESRLKDVWQNITPIAWDAVPFKPVRGVPYIRPTITQVDSVLVAGEIGDGAVYREGGLVMVQVFTPTSSGTRLNLELIDKLEETYRQMEVSKTRFGTPYSVVVGQGDTWYHVNFFCPFTYDVIT